MLDKIISSIVFVMFAIVTFFVFDFIRLAYNSDVYSNALLVVLGALMIFANLLIGVLVKSLK